MRRSLTSIAFMLCLTSGCLICLSAVYRSLRMARIGPAEVIEFESAGSALRLCMRARHSIKTQPGTYFYITFHNIPFRFRSRSSILPVVFWGTNERASTKEFSFLLGDSNPVTDAVRQLLRKRHIVTAKLNGPYRKILQLKDYSLVILLTEGTGITGLLPFTLSLLSRRKHNYDDKARGLRNQLYYDQVRKIDIIRRLDHNNQVKWASGFFQTLTEIKATRNTQESGKPKSVSQVNVPLLNIHQPS